MKQPLLVAFAGVVVISVGMGTIVADEIHVPLDYTPVPYSIDAVDTGNVVPSGKQIRRPSSRLTGRS